MKFFKIFVKESLFIIFLFCSLSSGAQENPVMDFKQKVIRILRKQFIQKIYM